jgi:hypothetical protein
MYFLIPFFSLIVAEFSDCTPLLGSSYSTEKDFKKKDSTGVRWVDWEGVAAISEKKGIRKYIMSI